jgi:hypothetical protein
LENLRILLVRKTLLTPVPQMKIYFNFLRANSDFAEISCCRKERGELFLIYIVGGNNDYK